MRKSMGWIVFFVALMSFSNAHALTIKEGTVSIGGSSSANFEKRSFKNSDDEREYSIDITTGYFAKDNLEFGLSLDYEKDYVNNYRDSTNKSAAPFISYHPSLNEHSNIYYGVGLIFTRYNENYSSGSDRSNDSVGYYFRGGWEYFFNSYVALDIGVRISRITWHLHGYSVTEDKETRFVGPRIGLIVFF